MSDTDCPICARQERAWESPAADRCSYHQTMAGQCEALAEAVDALWEHAFLAPFRETLRRGMEALIAVVEQRPGPTRWQTLRQAIRQAYPPRSVPILGVLWFVFWAIYSFAWHNPRGWVIFASVQSLFVLFRIGGAYRKLMRTRRG